MTSCNIIVLCDEQDLGHIYGFGAAEEIDGVLTVHYLYIKHPYRGLGLAKLLFKHLGGSEDVGFCYTHRTKKAEQYDKTYSTAIYHPYLAFRHYGEPHGSKEESVQKSKASKKEKKENSRNN
jgi:GNAT superfamily N-acetyltransferase